jgi:hypothetical protein
MSSKSASNPHASRIQRFLDPVIEEFTTGEYYREVYNAKEEFFEKAGIVYEDDADYEQRMSIFMDWYIFDRDLPGVDLSPIKLYFRKNREGFNAEELSVYRDFCSTVHSIFTLTGRPWFGEGLKVEDLFSKKDYLVVETDIHQGFTRGDLFEARLVPFQGKYEFSKGFCFHPVEMKSFILGEVKKVRNQDKARQTKLILQLSAMKLRHLRFQHIDVKHIYSFESRLGD